MNRLSKSVSAGLLVATGLWLWPVPAAAVAPGRLVRSRPKVSPVPQVRRLPEMVIPAGPHYLTTGAGNSHVPVYMPAGFFFDGSEPTAEMVELEGASIAEKPARANGFHWEFARLFEPGEDRSDVEFGEPIDIDVNWRREAPFDTVMVQFQEAVLPAIGSQATVDLKLADVRLRSLAPVEVTGPETRYYDLVLEIKSYHQGEGRGERMGWMTLTRDGLATGYFTSTVYGWARFVFTPVDGGEAVIYDHDEHLPISTNVPTPFIVPALLPAGQGGVAVATTAYCCEMGSFCIMEPVSCSLHCP